MEHWYCAGSNVLPVQYHLEVLDIRLDIATLMIYLGRLFTRECYIGDNQQCFPATEFDFMQLHGQDCVDGEVWVLTAFLSAGFPSVLISLPA